MTAPRFWIVSLILALLLISCTTQYPQTCPSSTPVGLDTADQIAADDSLPFRFPLDQSPIDNTLYFGWFGVSNECTPDIKDCYVYPEVLFHAAEDYKRPAGTPVYAIADGIIRYSDTAEGYGWLIVIDHPLADIYSLYGHLSPSRWTLENGTQVARGDLIGYLGDSYENGGTREQPVQTHLHFGIRTGQTMDYPANGEWRFHGGWIKLCPQDVGWLQPSLIITGQSIPAVGFPKPTIGFFTRWGFDLAFSGLYLVFGLFMIIRESRQGKRFILLLPGLFTFVAWLVLQKQMLLRGYLLPAIGVLLLAVGFYYLARRPIFKK